MWRRAALLTVLFPVAATAETTFGDLSALERAALGAEIAAVLRAEPELARQPDRPVPGYEEEIERDQSLIAGHAAELFAPEAESFGREGAALRIALFTGKDCANCTRARDTLKELVQRHDLRVTLFDAEADAALFQAIGADALPFYVLPKMMLRGEMPAPVLERYLANGTGQ